MWQVMVLFEQRNLDVYGEPLALTLSVRKVNDAVCSMFDVEVTLRKLVRTA